MADSAGRADDAARVALARRDPAAGWAAIWDVHGAALHGYCLRLLGDRADADDVVADVFLAAAQRLDQLRQPEALRAWLFAIGRRSVQARWRARGRTVAVDPQGATVMSQPSTIGTPDELAAIGASDAAELVQAASAGLSIDDRELLALTLGADLDTTEVVRVTGLAQNAVSVRVTRLKDTVARAAGALLVAQHHRRDCEELEKILAEWDGTFDTVWRKRIARHVDRCDACEERRRGAVAVFASPLFLAPPGASLRDRVLDPIRSVRPLGPTPVTGRPAGQAVTVDLEPTTTDGFPLARPWGRRRPSATRALAAAVATLVLVVVGVVMVGAEDDAELAAGGAASPSTSTTSTTDQTATTTSAPVATTAPLAEPAEPPAGGPAAPTSGIAVPPTPTATAEPPSPPAPPAPRVRLSVDPREVNPGCGGGVFADATVEVAPGAGGESTVISWDGPDAGSVSIDGTGTRRVPIGPFTQVDSSDGRDVVTVLATTTDAAGGAVVDDEPLIVRIVPC